MTSHTLAQLDHPSGDDDDEGCHLGVGENVLHPSSPLHIGRVDESQETWRRDTGDRTSP